MAESKGKIIWNTDVNAPCCPGEILNGDNEDESILIQTDWEYPSVAQSFGWSLREVQLTDENGNETETPCNHQSTDGTVDCECGITAGEFIEAARVWLVNNEGAIADDPGYFLE